MMKTAIRISSLILLFTLMATAAWAATRQYISAADLEARLKSDKPTHIVDIQVEDEYSQHHIKGATPTYAYPVKTEEDKAKVEALVERLAGDNNPVVIVCPRGAGGANRTYDYLQERGIATDRLLILEKGQEGWACAELTEGK